MVIKAYKSLLGEDWFQSFTAFRLNPETFLDKRKLTRDAFCLDVLKELYLDYIETQNKIHLLLLLQEYSSLLIKDTNLLEQVVGSLINLCDILGTKPDKRLLKNQTFVTIVTILLSQNLDHDFSRLVEKVKAILLDIIYNVSEDSTVISTACQCLEELEVFFPGSLEAEIKHLLETSERETSPSFQSYILLLSVCVKHLTAKLYQESSISHKIDDTKKNNTTQISSFVSHVLELLPYMTHIAVYRVLKDLIFVVHHSPDLTPTTFKLHLQNLMMSSDLPLFHLAFDLMDAFGSELVSAQEEKYLLMQVMKMSTHPCLTASHRLLFLDWLKSCTLNKDIAYISSSSYSSNLHLILPTPFDGPLTQEKKSYVLCLSIPYNSDKSSSGDFLNECINGLIKCSLLAGGTKAAPSLFRTLFVFYCSHQSEIMHNTMYKLLTGILKTSPHLTPYALSFLHSVKSKSPDSQFHERILGHLVEHILSIPMKQFLSNLEYYFCILGSASEEQASVCRPRAVLRLFQKLLNNEGFALKNSWSTGNEILSVCRTILKYHDVQIFYYDLAEVLCLITQIFDDADVKDRAKIYYTMLTSLSKLKVQTIFNLHSSVKDAKNALNTFVAGGDSSQFACIQKLSKPILKLIRMENKCEMQFEEENMADTFLSVCFSDILESYQKYLSTNEPIVKLTFAVRHVDGVDENLSNLYSIIINTHSEPPSKDISVIEIPVLKKNLKASQHEGTVVNLYLKPVEPYPLTLHFKAEFTCERGYNYTCHLPSVPLKFEDLFMPLPVPESVKIPAKMWRIKLFENLWNEFQSQINARESQSSYCQTLFCVKMGKGFFSIMEQRWNPFIIDRKTNETYFVALYLPHKNHILMKITVVNDMPLVNILVDNNSTLPWVTICLQDMSEGAKVAEV